MSWDLREGIAGLRWGMSEAEVYAVFPAVRGLAGYMGNVPRRVVPRFIELDDEIEVFATLAFPAHRLSEIMLTIDTTEPAEAHALAVELGGLLGVGDVGGAGPTQSWRRDGATISLHLEPGPVRFVVLPPA